MAEFKRYLFEYRFRGEEWGFEIMAESAEEAQARVKALPWAQYKGEIAATIEIPAQALFTKASFVWCFALGFALAGFATFWK